LEDNYFIFLIFPFRNTIEVPEINDQKNQEVLKMNYLSCAISPVCFKSSRNITTIEIIDKQI